VLYFQQVELSLPRRSMCNLQEEIRPVLSLGKRADLETKERLNEKIGPSAGRLRSVGDCITSWFSAALGRLAEYELSAFKSPARAMVTDKQKSTPD
jgi:hypothetical protein